MVKKEKLFIQVTPTKRLVFDRLSIDVNDSSPEAIAAFKKIIRPDEELYKPLDEAIDVGVAVKKGLIKGNENSRVAKAIIKERTNSRVLAIIGELTLKKIEPPALKEIMRAYEEKFKPETISKSRIEAAQRTIKR